MRAPLRITRLLPSVLTRQGERELCCLLLQGRSSHWIRNPFLMISCVLSRSVTSDSVTPWTAACPAPLSMGILPGRNTGVGGLALLQGNLPNPGVRLRSPALQVDSLPSEPPGKPKNPGVGSLSLLQGIFPAQESNWCLLHCRRILYQLSH